MFGFESEHASDDDFLAEVAEIAYQAMLLQGLTRLFLEVELEIWQQVRSAFRGRLVRSQPLLEVA